LNFGISLEVDYYELESTPKLEYLVIFGMSVEKVCHNLDATPHYKLIPILEGADFCPNIL
jgi:hypothetical protein